MSAAKLPPATVLVWLASLIGLAGYLAPFFLPGVAASGTSDHWTTGPFLALLLVALASVGAILSVAGQSVRAGGARFASLLASVIAINAMLRLVPGFGGASPVFLLVILTGARFGANAGFVCGSLSMLVSAMLTGGAGPWLPYQMLGMGWVGLCAALMPAPARRDRAFWGLLLFGAVTGLLYGALLNLSFWPFSAPGLAAADAGLYWTPGLSLAETLARYGRFYLATSLVHDLTRSAGNVILLFIATLPVLDLFDRFSPPLVLRDVDQPESADDRTADRFDLPRKSAARAS